MVRYTVCFASAGFTYIPIKSDSTSAGTNAKLIQRVTFDLLVFIPFTSVLSDNPARVFEFVPDGRKAIDPPHKSTCVDFDFTTWGGKSRLTH
jgi:hypothetical protein